MYSFLVDSSSEHKKAKPVNRNIVATISHGECKGVFLNNELRHLSNRTQSKNNRIGTYEIKKNSLSCFSDKISKTMDMMD